MSFFVVSGPAGPGEREEMLRTARLLLAESDVASTDVVRVDLGERGEGGEGGLRAELEPVVPILQSGSLFGGRQGLLIVDCHLLGAGEAEILADLIRRRDESAVSVAVVTAGKLAKPLAELAKAATKAVSVKKIWERSAREWLEREVGRRALAFEKGATEAMIARFGTDTSSMSRALDQLEGHRGRITSELVISRFRNRPDEPLYLYIDAVERGSTVEALRRLGDFLTHGHPLVVIGALDGDLRRRALAAAAPDRETLLAWLEGSPRQVDRLWRNRGRIPDSALRRAQEAILRADRVLKTQPEETHRVTMERLTVAMCRWYGR